MAEEDRPTVGVIGIGSMGFPIAEHYLQSGYSVVACDVRTEATDDFEAIGGTVADGPGALARRCDAVHIVVVSDEQVHEILEGPDGVFTGFATTEPTEGLVVIHSTVRPETVEVVATRAPEGVDVIDAAVSGGYTRAAEGDLSLMVGGDSATVEAYRPTLETIAREVYHLGPVGSGMAMKTLNNSIGLAQLVATVEAVDTGVAMGFDEDMMIDILKESTGNNSIVQRWEYWTHDYLSTHPRGPYGGVENSVKDMSIMLELVRGTDVTAPLVGLVSQVGPDTRRKLADRYLEHQDTD